MKTDEFSMTNAAAKIATLAFKTFIAGTLSRWMPLQNISHGLRLVSLAPIVIGLGFGRGVALCRLRSFLRDTSYILARGLPNNDSLLGTGAEWN
jgi:hypothetical protein